MIEWMFFDVGNVILNDDPAMAVVYKYIYDAINQNGINITFEELLYHREQSILKNRNGQHYRTVATKFLGEKQWNVIFKTIQKKLSSNWDKYSPLMRGIVPVIQNLYQQFNLGLLANQPREVIYVLQNYQVLQYFKVHVISALVGYQKPDRRIFENALDKAQCFPEESIMIGDRIDNDVMPAKALGMKTIWLKLPLEVKGYNPNIEFEKQYFKSINRASASHLQPQSDEERPDFVAQSFEQIVEGVNLLQAN